VALPRSLHGKLLARSFLVQGSWNYETMIGTGFAFVLLPVLRHLHRDDPEALRAALARHTELFNSHPYFATVAVGAVARLEAHRTDPALIHRFKTALRGSLGTVGDQLVWLALRPAAALLAVVLLMVGAPWWMAVSGFLIAYNVVHVWLRQWGLRTGLRDGLEVGKALRTAPFTHWPPVLTRLAVLSAGTALVTSPLVFGGLDPRVVVPALIGAVVGLRLGTSTRRVLWAALALVWVAVLLMGEFLV
jgi:mannose PTS system EIID component